MLRQSTPRRRPAARSAAGGSEIPTGAALRFALGSCAPTPAAKLLLLTIALHSGDLRRGDGLIGAGFTGSLERLHSYLPEIGGDEFLVALEVLERAGLIEVRAAGVFLLIGPGR